MNVLDQFSIPVSGLRYGLHEYDFQVEKDFFEAFEATTIKKGVVKVQFSLDKREDMYVLLFSLNGKVEVNCDRCLDFFELPIESEESLLVKFDEKEWEDADVIYIIKGTQVMNVSKYIYEFIHLAVPMTKTHDDAGGSCNPEMLKYLSDSEEEEKPSTSNPFKDALKGLNFEN